MDDLDQFVNRLLQLFSFHGVKSFTMDDIAKEFSISKKTLYQQFPNKQALLLKVFDLLLENILVQHQDLKKQYTCPIECLYVGDLKMQEMNQTNKSIIFNQLQKYYPSVYQQHVQKVFINVNRFFIDNYNTGVTKDLYLKNIPINYYCLYIINLFITKDAIANLKFEEINENEISQNMMLFYLNAITTNTGKNVLEEIKLKYIKK